MLETIPELSWWCVGTWVEKVERSTEVWCDIYLIQKRLLKDLTHAPFLDDKWCGLISQTSVVRSVA